ncbi:hypothetical protein EE612_046318, partial [Oryza sativa]
HLHRPFSPIAPRSLRGCASSPLLSSPPPPRRRRRPRLPLSLSLSLSLPSPLRSSARAASQSRRRHQPKRTRRHLVRLGDSAPALASGGGGCCGA